MEKIKNNKISIIAYIMITLLIISALVFLIISYITYTNSTKIADDNKQNDIYGTIPPIVEPVAKQYILSDYVTTKKVQTEKPKLYQKYNVNEVVFKNLPAETVQAFINIQQKSITSIKYIEILQEESANPQWVVDMSITSNIKDNVLYIKQFVEYPNTGEIPSSEYNYLAVDLDTNKLISTKDNIVKNEFNITKIVTAMYNSLESFAGENLTEGEKVITKEVFISDKTRNLNRLLEKINVDDYNIFVDDTTTEYIDYKKSQIMTMLGWGYPSEASMHNESIKLEK